MAEGTTCFSFIRSHRYAIYVLTLLMFVHMMKHLQVFSLVATNVSMSNDLKYGDKVCIDNGTVTTHTTSSANMSFTSCCSRSNQCENDVSECCWKYKGTGMEYQLLAGPLYIVIFAVSGVPLGLLAELHRIRRQLILAVCILLWSLMTIISGLATDFWHLTICRFALGIFSASCVPFSTSMIADYFHQYRGAAFGFFYWGVFAGFSLSFVLISVEELVGWRAVYYLMGVPGILMGFLVLFTVKEPPRNENKMSLDKLSTIWHQLRTACSHFTHPLLLTLCLGGAIRNGAGIAWAYNLRPYFDTYYPGTNVVIFMSWIPLVFGSTGAFGGGSISDKVTKNKGVVGRLIVLIVCCVISAPFQAGALLLPPPWAFVSHMMGVLLGEAWLAVCAAVVVELVPSDLSASSIAVYYFIIQVIGGNMNLFVPPLTDLLNLRLALFLCFPTLYLLAAAVFSVTLVLKLFCFNKSSAATDELPEEVKIDAQGSEEKSKDDLEVVKSLVHDEQV